MKRGDRVKFSAEGLATLYPHGKADHKNRRSKRGTPREWRGEIIGFGRYSDPQGAPSEVRVHWDGNHPTSIEVYSHAFLEVIVEPHGAQSEKTLTSGSTVVSPKESEGK
jgi:hypothetical protein